MAFAIPGTVSPRHGTRPLLRGRTWPARPVTIGDMARTTPALSLIHPTSAGAHAELALLRQLDAGLPDDYAVFHHLDWVDPGTAGATDRRGELDIAVVNAAGDLLLLEVKAGELEWREQGLFKTYGDGPRPVEPQLRRQWQHAQDRLREAGLLELRVLQFLALPHQALDATAAGTWRYPRARVLDAGACQDLAGVVRHQLGPGLKDPDRHARVCAWLLGQMPGRLDPAVIGRLAGAVREQRAAGLATWVPRIEAPSGILRVRGTAGSGKTQLALRLLNDASVRRERAAYVCFNRPLADHVRGLAPEGSPVHTFHQRCWEAAGRPAPPLDHAALAAAYAAATEGQPGHLDLLVVDELQDWQPAWVQALLPLLKDNGRLVLLDDPDQSLYPDRQEFELADTVTVTSMENFRSPRALVQLINALGLSERPVLAEGPLDEGLTDMTALEADPAPRAEQAATERAVRRMLERGHAPQDILVATWRGREHAPLLGLDRLAGLAVNRFTGDYDSEGEPVWTGGELTVDTLRRLKGRSAPAVVLSGVDIADLGPRGSLARRLLFTGLTRAQMDLALVVSARTAQALQRAMADGGATG